MPTLNQLEAAMNKRGKGELGNVLRTPDDRAARAVGDTILEGTADSLPPWLSAALATAGYVLGDPMNLLPGGAIGSVKKVKGIEKALGKGPMPDLPAKKKSTPKKKPEAEEQKKLGQGGSNVGTTKPVVRADFRGGRERREFPGIYGDPSEVVGAVKVAPESGNLSRLFGTTRKELSEIALSRDSAPGGWKSIADARERGLWLPEGAPKNRLLGAESAQRIMTPSNERRLGDLWEAARTERPELYEGMTGWYVSDPMYQRMVDLLGPEDAAKEFLRRENVVSLASPGSDVLTEINRGSRAAWLDKQGRFGEFMKHGGNPANRFSPPRPGQNYPGPHDPWQFDPELSGLRGHAYHSTSQAPPMQNWLEKGSMGSAPKVPSYGRAWHPTDLPGAPFQSHLPVGDAHWSRLMGLADVRKNKAYAQSASMPEMLTLGPWYDRLAREQGLQGVPGQALHWGIGGPQTGVQTPVGAPKLEIIADLIDKTAKKRGMKPEHVRDLYLAGDTSIGNIDPRLLIGMGIGSAGAAGAGAMMRDDNALLRYDE